MMHEREKSDLAVVAVQLANKAERSAAELVERRAGTKGNAGQQSTRRTQRRESLSQALDRIRQEASDRRAVTHPRWERVLRIGSRAPYGALITPPSPRRP